MSNIVQPKWIKLTEALLDKEIMLNVNKIIYYEVSIRQTEIYCEGMSEPITVKENNDVIKAKLCQTYNFA